MTEATTPASGEADTSAHPGIVSVQTRPAKTLPGLVGVLLALVGLGLIVGGGVGVTVAGPLAVLIPVGVILFIIVLPGQYVVQPNQALVLDQDAKASLVANLLVVLTSEQQTTPVVNTGSSS